MSRHGKVKSPTAKRPKTKLGLHDLDHSKSAVLDSVRSPESKRGYRHPYVECIPLDDQVDHGVKIVKVSESPVIR